MGIIRYLVGALIYPHVDAALSRRYSRVVVAGSHIFGHSWNEDGAMVGILGLSIWTRRWSTTEPGAYIESERTISVGDMASPFEVKIDTGRGGRRHIESPIGHLRVRDVRADHYINIDDGAHDGKSTKRERALDVRFGAIRLEAWTVAQEEDYRRRFHAECTVRQAAKAQREAAAQPS